MSFCVASVALCHIPTCLTPCRQCQKWGKSRTKCSFCCVHVSRLESLVSLWRRRVYGGSCKNRVSSRISAFPLKTSVSACPLASPCLWGKLRSRACFAALTSPCLWGKLQNLSLCLSSGVPVSLSCKVLCASFVVQSRTGNLLRKLCSTKSQNTGNCFMQAL